MSEEIDYSLHGLRALIVEDDAVALMQLTRAVYQAGMEVYSYAADGITGFNLAVEGRPDILLLDVWMPYLPGTEVARRVFEHYTPCVIFVTAYGQDVLSHESEQVRNCPIIEKPVAGDVLLPQISSAWADYLKQHRPREPRRKSG